MCQRVPGRRRLPHIVRLAAADGGWQSPPVIAAFGPWRRFCGLAPLSVGTGLLMAGSGVHGRGMAHALGVVGLERTGRVVEIRRLEPGRRTVLAGADLVLELPPGDPLPAIGLCLTARPMLGLCRGD